MKVRRFNPDKKRMSMFRGHYTPLMLLGTFRFNGGIETRDISDAPPALLYNASDYCKTRVRDYESREPQNHRARNGAKFYRWWDGLITKALENRK